MRSWRVSVAAMMAVLPTSVAAGQTSGIVPVDSAVTAQWLAREEALERAILDRDVARMQSIFADDFVFYYHRGRSSPRDAWVAQAVHNGFRVRRISNYDVELHGDIAISSGQLYVEDRDDGEGPAHTYRYVRVWRNGAGGWRLISHRTVAAPTRRIP